MGRVTLSESMPSPIIKPPIEDCRAVAPHTEIGVFDIISIFKKTKNIKKLNGSGFTAKTYRKE